MYYTGIIFWDIPECLDVLALKRYSFGAKKIMSFKPEDNCIAHLSTEDYAELEQTRKYISPQCCTSFHPCRCIRKQFWPGHKNGLIHLILNPGHRLKKNGSTRVSDAVYQVSWSSASWFRRRFLKFFTIYGHGHVTWNIWTNFLHTPWRLHKKFVKFWIWVTLDQGQWPWPLLTI